MENKIKNYIENFFTKLEINIKFFNIENKEKNLYFVKIESDDSSLLIWTHWKTIESLQRILSMCINNISENKIKLKLEINNYSKTSEDRLFLKVDHSIISLKNNGWEYELWNLSPYERKKVHNYVIKNYDNIWSKSRWSWENRKIFLLLKNKKEQHRTKSKLTIDINWDSI